MIAKNYLKYPEALRFQCELFHNGFKNSPRIMRLMECVFNFAPATPQWAKGLARKARNLVKAWKAAQICINWVEVTGKFLARAGTYLGPMGESWSGRGLTPKWLSSLVKNGLSKESFKVQCDTWASRQTMCHF